MERIRCLEDHKDIARCAAFYFGIGNAEMRMADAGGNEAGRRNDLQGSTWRPACVNPMIMLNFLQLVSRLRFAECVCFRPSGLIRKCHESVFGESSCSAYAEGVDSGQEGAEGSEEGV